MVKFAESQEPRLQKTKLADTDPLKAVLKQYRVQRIKPLAKCIPSINEDCDAPIFRYYLLKVPTDVNHPNLVESLEADPRVEFALLDKFIKLDSVSPSDALYSQQWGLNNGKKAKLHFPDAWEVTVGSENTVVAVLDTGVDLSHPDLAGKATEARYNFWDGNEDVTDQYGHGTAVASVIAANTNGGSDGIAGICWRCKIMPVKVCRDNDNCSIIPLIGGVYYAARKQVDVISISLGGYEGQISQEEVTSIQDAVNYAYEQEEVVLIAAAGNKNTDVTQYPSSLEHVISVGATNWEDERCAPGAGEDHARNCSWGSPGSNFGDRLDIMAPGGRVFAADILGDAGFRGLGDEYNGDYDPDFRGTSAAAPHVSGLAALILSYNPNLSPDDVEHIIKESANKIGEHSYDSTGRNDYYGHGRINAYQALQLTPPETPITLNITALLEGPYGDPPDHSTDVAIRIHPTGESESLFEKTITTNANGQYNGLEISGSEGFNLSGYYDVFAVAKYRLARKKTVYLAPGENSIDFITDGGLSPLLAGDLNEDNRIDQSDRAIMFADWSVNNLRSDFNHDGIVNNADDIYIRMNWHKVGDTVWSSSDQQLFQTQTQNAFPSRPNQNDAVLFLTTPTPPPSHYNVGDEIEYLLRLNTYDSEIDGVDIVVEYDPGVLEVVSITPHSVLPNVNEASDYPELGEVVYSTSVNQGDSYTTNGSLVNLATLRFQVIADVFEGSSRIDTDLKIRHNVSYVIESVVAEHGTGVDLLGRAGEIPLNIEGEPYRARPTIEFVNPPVDPEAPGSSEHAMSNRNLIPIEVNVNDPHNHVNAVQFTAEVEGVDERYRLTDSEGIDGWGVAWDVSEVPDDWAVPLRALVYIAGRTSPVATTLRWLTLDKTPPLLESISFTPSSPSNASSVEVDVCARDDNSKLDHFTVYVNKASDGSTDGPWSVIGHSEIPGHSWTCRSYTWDTNEWPAGTYRVIVERQDKAGNLSLPFGPDEPEILFELAPCELTGNVDGDRDVDVNDVNEIVSRWRCQCDDDCYDSTYDLNNDCTINLVDVMLATSHWGDGC